jgi:NAD(P)H-dependent FMN reductase
MIKKIVIISVTSRNNLILAKKIALLFNLKNEIITLEDYNLPLYDGKVVLKDSSKINSLSEKLISAEGFVFCGPEYNGGSAPILTNAITWISVSTNHWRDAFLNKKGIVATHSGGGGNSFLSTFKQQLKFMGVIVYPKSIKVNKNKDFDVHLSKKIIQGFEKTL